jgi:hypothetical protein
MESRNVPLAIETSRTVLETTPPARIDYFRSDAAQAKQPDQAMPNDD